MDRPIVREQAAELARAYKREWDAVAALSLAVRQVSSLIFSRVEESGKLQRQLTNTAIPLHDPALDKRMGALIQPQSEQALTRAYEALMKAIEALPIQERSRAVEALRRAMGE
jgi:hypothetical protein